MEDKSEAVRVASWITGILGLLGIMITVFGDLALPFVENFADKMQNTPVVAPLTGTVQQELDLTDTITPQSVIIPISTVKQSPTETQMVEAIINPTSAPSASVKVLRPAEQEYANLTNIWDLVRGDRGPTNPTTNFFSATIDPNSTYGWGAIWCGINYQTLQEILSPLSMNLVINDKILTGNEVIGFYTTKNGWSCYRWGTKLSNWKSGETVRLELRYFLSETIHDGDHFTYEGNYNLVIDVQVR